MKMCRIFTLKVDIENPVFEIENIPQQTSLQSLMKIRRYREEWGEGELIKFMIPLTPCP